MRGGAYIPWGRSLNSLSAELKFPSIRRETLRNTSYTQYKKREAGILDGSGPSKRRKKRRPGGTISDVFSGASRRERPEVSRGDLGAGQACGLISSA